MKKPIKIGPRKFQSKKDALMHYKLMLNSYAFGQSLNDKDFDDLLSLLDYSYFSDTVEANDSEISLELRDGQLNDIVTLEIARIESEEVWIDDIKVSKVQFGSKCFEVCFSDKSSQYISYLMIINNQSYTPEKLFSIACRNCINRDLITVKLDYFNKNSVRGLVKCQETGKLSKWNELVIDHRQPNTLSIIIDRFKEVNVIEISGIEYKSENSSIIIFKKYELTQKFIAYHQDKANLRIIRKECNAARASMGRVKRNTKDLVVKSKDQLSLF